MTRKIIGTVMAALPFAGLVTVMFYGIAGRDIVTLLAVLGAVGIVVGLFVGGLYLLETD